jgi:hypothetical protein
MCPSRVILIDVDPDDFALAARTVKWMEKQAPSQKDGILAFGDGSTVDFYIRRNKKSLTVRRISRAQP